MKAENLLSAYRALTKRKYTTRARLAEECGFSLMSATNAARLLISLGLVREWKPKNEGKLFANDITYTLAHVDLNFIYTHKYDKRGILTLSESRARNHSFPAAEDICGFINETAEPCELFPIVFVVGISENELRIFSDSLGTPYHIIPDDTDDVASYMIEFMFRSKIENKGIANCANV